MPGSSQEVSKLWHMMFRMLPAQDQILLGKQVSLKVGISPRLTIS